MVSAAVAPSGRTLTRRLLVALFAAVALTLAASGIVAVARDAHADSSSSLVAMANSARASAGLPALAVSGDLSAAARAQAGRMASSGTLAHTPNLPQVVCCWSNLGENVGVGGSASILQAAFMASPEHRANILSSSYTQVGVGVVVDGSGRMWVSEIFRRPSGSVPPAPRPQPAVTHVSAPRPVTHAVPRPPVVHATPRPATPAATVALTRASRDLARVPLEAAHRFAAELASTSAVQGADPVSRVLDFVAVNARLAG